MKAFGYSQSFPDRHKRCWFVIKNIGRRFFRTVCFVCFCLSSALSQIRIHNDAIPVPATACCQPTRCSRKVKFIRYTVDGFAGERKAFLGHAVCCTKVLPVCLLECSNVTGNSRGHNPAVKRFRAEADKSPKAGNPAVDGTLNNTDSALSFHNSHAFCCLLG